MLQAFFESRGGGVEILKVARKEAPNLELGVALFFFKRHRNKPAASMPLNRDCFSTNSFHCFAKSLHLSDVGVRRCKGGTLADDTVRLRSTTSSTDVKPMRNMFSTKI